MNVTLLLSVVARKISLDRFYGSNVCMYEYRMCGYVLSFVKNKLLYDMLLESSTISSKFIYF